MAYKQIRRRTQPELGQTEGATPEVNHAPDISQIQTDRDLMTADDALALQDVVGNRATGQLMGAANPSAPPHTGYVQPKPIPPQPQRPGSSLHAPAYAHLRRKPTLQRASWDGSFDTNADFESQVNQQSGGGKPLPSDVRADLEPKFGADFSGVKVHADAKAAQLSQDVGAQAFTHGSDIYFNQGKYNPESSSGKHLLAHELTHTVQQGGAGQVQPKTLKNETNLVNLQRAPMTFIQRDVLTEWKTVSIVKNFFGFSKNRGTSTELNNLDKAVEAFSGTMPGEAEKYITNGNNVLEAIKAWRAKTPRVDTINTSKLEELERFVDDKVQQKIAAIELNRVEMEKALPLYQTFKSMDPELAEYAVRDSSKGQDRFKPSEAIKGGLLDMLSLPRDKDGKLTQEAIDMYVKNDLKQNLDPNLKKMNEGGVKGFESMSKEDIRKLMNDNKNAITGKTKYPELANLVEESDETDADVTETKSAGGTSITVTYNPTDANFAGRWGIAKAAVAQLNLAGFEVPAFKLYLPKYSRQLSGSTTGHTHEIRSDSTKESNASIFAAPNNIFISSETYQNPKVSTGLSAKLDPSGIASFIHELGHYLHFHNAPAKFAGLTLTQFKGNEPTSGKTWTQFIKEAVSTYGSGNPREVVAEITLGLAYGKTFSDELMKMYKAFGGALPKAKEKEVEDIEEVEDKDKDKQSKELDSSEV